MLEVVGVDVALGEGDVGAFQSLNSTSSTFNPCLPASLTATSSGGAKAAVVPIFSGASAAWAGPLPRRTARLRVFRVFSMVGS